MRDFTLFPASLPRRIAPWLPVLLGGLCLALGPGCGRAPAGKTGTAKPAGPALVVAEGWKVEAVNMPVTIPAVGTVVANESVEVVPETSGRMLEIGFDEGKTVRKGDLLARLDTMQLEAALQEKKASRNLANANYQRLRNLLKGNSASRQEYDEAENSLAVIDAQIRALEVQMEKNSIRAPFDGRLGLRRVSVGAWVTPSTVLTTLQDVHVLKIDFTLAEVYANDVQAGQTFRFRPASSDQLFAGKVVALEPQIEPGSRTLRVRGLCENPGSGVLPGSFASVELDLQRKGGAILIPSLAVIPSARGHAVFVLESGTARQREIRIGQRTPDRVEVTEGLQAGEVILISNLLRLRPGIAVQLEEKAPASQP